MIDHLNTPFFDPDTIRDALENMRKGRSIRRSPLLNLVWIRTLDHWGAFSDVAIDVVLRDALAEIVEAQLHSYRAYEELSDVTPRTRREVIDQLRADFQVQNVELEAWSVILHRYVRLDFGLQVQALADAAHVTARQIRRRLNHGLFRLAEEVTGREREARQHNRQLALLVKLPPATFTDLYGRDALCDDVVEHILHGGTSHMTILSGMGGVGKSSVAHRVTGRLIEAEHFEDLIWLTLDRPLDYSDLLHDLADTLTYVAVFEHGDRGLAHNIGIRLRQIRTLLVVDAIDYLDDYTGHLAQLGHLMGGGHLLATSRHSPDSEAPLVVVPVAPLDAESFQQFLEQEFRRQRLTTPSDEVLRKIMSITDGNPLAGKLIVRRMKVLPLETILADLGDQPTFEDGRLLDYLFARIWEDLSMTAQQVAIGVILLPDIELPYDELAHLLGMKPEELPDALGQLVESLLLAVRGDPPGYRLSGLIRQFVWREAGRDRHRPLVQQFLTHMRSMDASDVMPRLEMIDRALSLTQHQSLMPLSPDALRELIEQTQYAFRLSRGWRQWQHVLEQMEIMISESESEWTGLLPTIWTELGAAHRQQGRLQEAEAYAHQAVEAFGETGSFQQQGRALIELGRAYQARGLDQPAREAYQRSAAAGKRFEDGELWQRAANRLAQLVLEQGQPEDALGYLTAGEEGDSVERAADDPETLLLRGQAHLAKGDFAEASNLLEASHQRYIEEGDIGMVARTHFQIALAAYQVGETDRALEHIQRGFSLMVALGDYIGLSRLITLMGIVRLEEGQAERALAIWEAARELQSVVGDVRGQAFTLFHLADLYWKMARIDDARNALVSARMLAEELGIALLMDEIQNHPLHESGGGGYNGDA